MHLEPGSLFRLHTKAVNLTQADNITKNWFLSKGIIQMNVFLPEKQYPNLCYQHILHNPVKAGLVKRPEDWEFSSAQDAIGLRNGKLINRELIKKYGLLYLQSGS